jgi:hypothetical protein
VSPAAPIAHLVGIALGVFGGLWLGGVVAPDLPSASTEPGISIDDDVKGADAESLYHPAPLDGAVKQTIEQLGPGAEVSRVTIRPTTLTAESADAAETEPLESMPLDAPETMVAGVQAAREEIGVKGEITLDDFSELTWTPGNPDGREWYALLDITSAGPPTEFWASRNGAAVKAGAP